MVIRLATWDDVEQMIPLMLAYIVDFYKRPHPGEDAVRDLIQHLLNHPDHGVQFVADRGETLVGFTTLYFTFSTLRVKRAAILNDLFVHPKARGQKIGESLFRRSLAYSREQGFAYMQWETAKDNRAAQALYDKMGGQLSDLLVYEIE